jgi:hypothetical protein
MIGLKRLKARKGTYSMQGCSHWEETVITKDKIYYKQKSSCDHKPRCKYKKELYRGKSTIPPT